MNILPDKNTHAGLAIRRSSQRRESYRLPGSGWSWLILSGFLVVLGLISLPCMACVQVKGMQVKALAQARQIGLALKMFAGDHDGNYPRQGKPTEMKGVPANSNQAFACLLPAYVQSETLFGNNRSAYQPGRGPDNRIDDPYTGHPVETLRPGENVYGYMLGLTAESEPEAPLVADGADGHGHYTSDQWARGGVWGGAKAVVIRLDQSAALENLVGPAKARYVPRRDDATQNLLDSAHWGKNVRYLDPAVATP